MVIVINESPGTVDQVKVRKRNKNLINPLPATSNGNIAGLHQNAQHSRG